MKGTIFVAWLALSWLLAGCAADRFELGENIATLIISGENAEYVRQAGVYLDADRAVVRGRVRPGNVGHIPHNYLGHIDLFVFDAAGNLVEKGLVKLGSRQRLFFYYLKAAHTDGSSVMLTYYRRAHVSEHDAR